MFDLFRDFVLQLSKQRDCNKSEIDWVPCIVLGSLEPSGQQHLAAETQSALW